jgi:hypothetical protein
MIQRMKSNPAKFKKKTYTKIRFLKQKMSYPHASATLHTSTLSPEEITVAMGHLMVQ